MQVILLKVPPAMREELGRRLRGESGQGVGAQVLQAESLEALPEVLPPGLVVVWDAGGAQEELVALCRHLHARRSSARTQLTVLTQRSGAACEALAQAGADECLVPPGENWGVRLMALHRRLHLDGLQAPAMSRLERQRISPEQALHTLLASTSAETGEELFRGWVAQLASAFQVSGALVGALSPSGERLQLLALWSRGTLQELSTCPLQGTAHQQAIAHGSCHVEDDVRARFPEDPTLVHLGARGYLGVVLRDSQRGATGVLALAHAEPLEAGGMDYALLGAFAARAGAELERHRTRTELVHTRDFLRNTLDAVPDPVFVKDRAHRFVTMNRAFARVMGRPADQLLGMSDYDFVPAQEADVFWEKDEQVFASGQPNENEEVLTDSEGVTRVIVTKKAPFTGTSGEPFLVGIIQDVSEARRLEMQLRLADRMASVGTLAAGVAHEINNPLAYISSNLAFLAELLAQDELMPGQRAEMREAVLESLEGAGRVRLIAQDLKTFARADDETQGPVDVHRVIQGALRLVRNELQLRARLNRTLEPVPSILGNEARLGQVIVNLLVNALQAFPAERPIEDNCIRIATWSEAEQIHIEVEDNGKGMTPEVQRRIFDPFFTTKPVGVGTGLGLSICNTLIQVMGGSIEVQSAPGWGSTFRLVLPAYSSQAQGVSAPRAPRPLQTGPRRRVLLIDDEPSVGTAVRRLLREFHEVFPFQDAREALQLITQGERFDAILCDVMMQGMSGVEFVQELERHVPELARRTGFMSAGVFSPQAREFIDSRSIDLLPKPFERESLRLFVERLCR